MTRPSGRAVAEHETPTNAASIVRACSAHDDLLAALRAAKGVMGKMTLSTNPDKADFRAYEQVCAALSQMENRS